MFIIKTVSDLERLGQGVFKFVLKTFFIEIQQIYK